MKIAIGCDHGGYELKEKVVAHLKEKGYEVKDCGCNSKASVDYPVYGKAAAEAVASGECEKGIVICTTGIGISISANKVKGIRCAKVSTKEEAEVTRIDNDSNIVAFGEKTSFDEALAIVKTFINTESSDLEKHKRRINKIKEYEETH